MIKNIFAKSQFKKNIMVLMAGSAVAQAVPIAISPILTRIYSPKEFGLMALYLSLCSLLSVFSSARYDLAIIEPKENNEAKHLLAGSLALSAIISFLLFIAACLFNKQITSLLGNADISFWLYVAPITVFTLSCYSIFTYWLNRHKRFKDMSINRVVNSSSTTFISLFLGFLNYISSGLILGYLLGQITAVLLLWKKTFREKFNFEVSKIYKSMKKYSHYPKYLVPATFAGTASGEIPILLLTKYFDASISGYFSFTNRVTISPLSLIGNSIGEVYRQKAVEEYNQFGNCKALFIRAFTALFVVGLIPLLILFFYSVPLFTFVFGEKWAIAGKMAKYTSFLIFFQLLSTPLAYTIVLNKSQKMDMVLQIGRATLSIVSIVIGYYFADYLMSVICYTISYSLYYISHSFLQYRAACGHK